MTAKEQLQFIRRQAYHVELHYRNFRIYLVGSDEGWWMVSDLLENTRFDTNQHFSNLDKAIKAVDVYRDYIK